jgi:hypothetical protein
MMSSLVLIRRRCRSTGTATSLLVLGTCTSGSNRDAQTALHRFVL